MHENLGKILALKKSRGTGNGNELKSSISGSDSAGVNSCRRHPR